VGDEVLHADHAGLDAARADVSHLAGVLDALVDPLGRAHTLLLDGAGEFSGGLEAGADRLLLVGAEALSIYTQAAALVAGNIGATNVDLLAVDVDTTVRL
jgi:hypothetical protein